MCIGKLPSFGPKPFNFFNF
jgi:hypothetical protein